ncbi:MAG: GspH/FimT family pseudopilin [Deltaproteobacteria bacterium]|nr:GspH/FimT family pseudopilin [Deltaproteobacteria bacterium]
MNNQKGMTLIELIIVVVIMGVMFIMAIPTFTSTSHSKLKSAVRDVATELQMARMKAIYRNVEFRVLFSPGSPFGYKLEKGNKASGSDTWTNDHAAVAGYNTSSACSSSSLNANGYFCIEGVTITVTGSLSSGAQFNTNGTSSSGSIRFKNLNDSNDKSYISLSDTTGRVNIVDCTKVTGDTICGAF